MVVTLPASTNEKAGQREVVNACPALPVLLSPRSDYQSVPMPGKDVIGSVRDAYGGKVCGRVWKKSSADCVRLNAAASLPCALVSIDR